MQTRVAFQGSPGSFSHNAARRMCGSEVEFVGTNRFREIFELVSSNRVAMGIIPVENAIAGSVHEVYDLLGAFELPVVSELYCPVRLSLLIAQPPSDGDSEGTIRRLEQVISHPKALEQCSLLFQQYPNLSPVIHADTAGAAKEVAARKASNIAALASDEAAEMYGLHVLRANVQNHQENTTRFFGISKQAAERSGCNKASFILTLKHVPGSLARALSAFAGAGVNLTKIESRPIAGKPYEYHFFVDAQGQPEQLRLAVESCRQETDEIRELGYYRAAE